MNNLYLVGQEDHIKSADEVGHDLRGIDDLLPLDLDAADGKKRLKHRCHKRFQLTENAFALIRPISAGPLKIDAKSMGCIACAVFNARPAKLGKIENISMGGLMFRYVESRTQLSEVPALDILLADCGFYLANIPYKTLSDVAVHEDLPGNPIEMRQIRLQFQKLNATQHTELKNFIINHSTESGDINVNE